MRRLSGLTGLILALTGGLVAPVQAAPPEPAPPPWLPQPHDYLDVYWSEGWTGQDGAEHQEEGVAVRAIDRRWVTLSYMESSETLVVKWYNTRRGSKFFLNYCDEDGLEYSTRVTRRVFMDRVESTPERSAGFQYDADADSGMFSVWTLYDNHPDYLPCPTRPR